MDGTASMHGEMKARIDRLDATAALLDRDAAALNARIRQYKDSLTEKNYDGRGLERISLTTIFRELKNARPETVSARAALFATWLKQNEALSDLNEAGALMRRLAEERAQLLAGADGSRMEEPSALAEAQHRLKELEKMVIAGRDALASLDSVEEDLIKVEELGEASGGMLSSAVILEYAHAALAQAGLAQRLIYVFRYSSAGEDGCDTDALTGFAECFLDSLVMNFVPRGRVHDSLTCVRGAQNSLSLIVVRLDVVVEAQREVLCMLRIQRTEQDAV